MHAPNNEAERFPAVTVKGNIAYIAWDIFSAYGDLGHLCFKEIFTDTVNRLMGDSLSVRTELPDRGVCTLTRQEKEKRSILHLLFAHTTVRGRSTEVIEDTVPLYNVRCEVKYENKPSRVYLAPEKEEIPFEYDNGRVIFTVPAVDIHAMAVIED